MTVQHISAETLTHVIKLARDARSEKKPDRGTTGFQTTAKEQTLIDYIDALPDDEKAELLAIMWIGRRDGARSPAEFDATVAHARTTLDHAGSYMEEKQPLVDYLREGRKLLGI